MKPDIIVSSFLSLCSFSVLWPGWGKLSRYIENCLSRNLLGVKNNKSSNFQDFSKILILYLNQDDKETKRCQSSILGLLVFLICINYSNLWTKQMNFKCPTQLICTQQSLYKATVLLKDECCRWPSHCSWFLVGHNISHGKQSSKNKWK